MIRPRRACDGKVLPGRGCPRKCAEAHGKLDQQGARTFWPKTPDTGGDHSSHCQRTVHVNIHSPACRVLSAVHQHSATDWHVNGDHVSLLLVTTRLNSTLPSSVSSQPSSGSSRTSSLGYTSGSVFPRSRLSTLFSIPRGYRSPLARYLDHIRSWRISPYERRIWLATASSRRSVPRPAPAIYPIAYSPTPSRPYLRPHPQDNLHTSPRPTDKHRHYSSHAVCPKL